MTREEAKEALSVLKIYDNQWLREAIDMAIEALSADTVSREVYDAMVKHAKALENLSIEDRVRIMYDAVEDIHNIRIINEVVRCKDCIYKCLYDYDEPEYYYCALEDRPNRNWSVDDTDYCSWGERR